jgi:CRISPR type I-E-associated protein CasB/Cse2
MTTTTIPTFHERCRKVALSLIKICQDRSVCSALRPLLTGLPEAEIRSQRYLPQREGTNESLFTLVAGLVAEYPCPLPEERLSFGTSMWRLANHPDVNNKGVERRLDLLLQLEQEALVSPLHGLIVQARGAKILVDYGELLYHLHHWDNPERWVQLRWAKHYWCPVNDPSAEPTTEE